VILKLPKPLLDSNGRVGYLTHVSPATAQRDLAELAELGILRVEGAGRSVRYVLES
jgi:Fic family protein